MKNPNAESCQAFFNMYIPEEAFISDFRMTIKNETFVAKVETKEQAKKIFEGSDGSSGLVSSKVEFKETNHVRTVNSFFSLFTIWNEIFFHIICAAYNMLSHTKMNLKIKKKYSLLRFFVKTMWKFGIIIVKTKNRR